MKCTNCKKCLWFWNRFNRKHGEGMMVDKDYNLIERVRFCSEECCFEYQKEFDIDFRKEIKK